MQAKKTTADEVIQKILAQIVAEGGHGPFTFDGETFVIAKSGGKWAMRSYERPEPKVIE
jgi:hypothetical protein